MALWLERGGAVGRRRGVALLLLVLLLVLLLGVVK